LTERATGEEKEERHSSANVSFRRRDTGGGVVVVLVVFSAGRDVKGEASMLSLSREPISDGELGGCGREENPRQPAMNIPTTPQDSGRTT